MSIDLSTVSLPFDRTGEAVANRIGPERHTLTSVNWSQYNIIIPKYAPFYSDSITHLVHYPSGRTLERGVDWIEGWYFQSASGEIGLNLHCCIYFYDPSLVGEIEIPSYQAMGGEWQLNVEKLTYVLANQLLNPLRYYWEQAANLPEIFPPLDHDQDIEDFTRLGSLIDALGGIEQALRDAAAGGSASDIAAHLTNTQNPHGTTAAQLNLGNVRNYPMATLTDINLSGLNPNCYLDPVMAKQLIDSIVNPALAGHVDDKNNPHNTTPAKIGAYSIEEVDLLLNNLAAGLIHNVYAYRLEGKSVNDIVTMAQTGSSSGLDQLTASIQAVDDELATHTQSVANPHGVQADQTGAYFKAEIDSLLATLASGLLHNLYAYRLEGKSVDEIVAMAQTGASSAFDALQTEVDTIDASLLAHAQSLTNPHGVQANQTGAYFKAEVDSLLQQLAAGTLYSVTADKLGTYTASSLITAAVNSALSSGDGRYAYASSVTDLNTRVTVLEADIVRGSGSAVVIAAGATHSIDLRALFTDPTMAQEYDLAGAMAQVTVLDEVAGSPTNGSYINSEALITRAIRGGQYLDIYNHSASSVTVEIRYQIYKL